MVCKIFRDFSAKCWNKSIKLKKILSIVMTWHKSLYHLRVRIPGSKDFEASGFDPKNYEVNIGHISFKQPILSTQPASSSHPQSQQY